MTPKSEADSTPVFRMYPSVLPAEYARLKYRPEGSRPDMPDTVVRTVPYEPADSSQRKAGSGVTKAVFILTLAPKAPAPLADVPRPRWTWTPDSRAVRAGILTQNTSWDSASFRVMPFRVTLTCEPLEPRMVIAEFPRPVPPSL